MKKVVEYIQKNYFGILGMTFLALAVFLFSFLIVDCTAGKVITVTGQVIGHRYKPSWDEECTENVAYDLGNGETMYLPRYYTVHHSEQFLLTVIGPDGPDEYFVDHALYVFYQDGQDVPIYRRIGGYSGRCLNSWISK